MSCGAPSPTEFDPDGTRELSPDASQALGRRSQLQHAIGTTFELRHLVGQGGFGEVWAAWDTRLKRDVAVKVLLAELAGSPGLHLRFAREAEAAAKLRHPNIVPIYQVGDAEGLAFIVMPLVRGESLRSLLARDGAPAIPEARRILQEAALALDAAHRAGIVHRDVKPENIMLEGDERRVLLMDFGIARAIESEGSRLTGTGLVIGTPQYMSPEQATAEKHIDHRADIYSLGVVAYELLTGRLPFEAESVRDLIVQHLTLAAKDPRSVRPDIPEDVAETVLKCLAKRPEERWQSAGDLASAFSPPVTVSVESPLHWLGRKFRVGTRSARRRMLIFGVAFSVAMAALAWFSRDTLTLAWYNSPLSRSDPPKRTREASSPFRLYSPIGLGLSVNLISIGETLLVATSPPGGPVRFNGRTWEVIPIGDPILPPIHVGAGLWIYSRDGNRSIGYLLSSRGAIAGDTVRGSVVATWSGDDFALLGLSDGGVLRGHPGAWRREPTGTTTRLRAIWGNNQRQVALGMFAQSDVTDSLLVFNGLNWSTADPRPPTLRDRETWLFNAGVLLDDSTVVVAGEDCSALHERPCRGLLIELPPGVTSWRKLGPRMPDSVEFTVLWGASRNELWVSGRGGGCHSPACVFRVTSDSVMETPGFGRDSVLGFTRLAGDLVAMTAAGLLWANRNGQWGLLGEVLGSRSLGLRPTWSGYSVSTIPHVVTWSAASVIRPGVGGATRVVQAGVSSGNTMWYNHRPVVFYRFQCQSNQRISIALQPESGIAALVVDEDGRDLAPEVATSQVWDSSGRNTRWRWTCPDNKQYRIGVRFLNGVFSREFRLSVRADDSGPTSELRTPRATASPPSGSIVLGSSISGRFDSFARHRALLLSTSGAAFEMECRVGWQCSPATDAAIPTPVLDIARAGELLAAATARGVYVRRRSWEALQTDGAMDSIVAIAGSADTVLAALTPDAVWLWRAGAGRWTRWQAVPERVGRPQRLAIAAGGRAAIVMGDASTALLRDSTEAEVLTQRPVSDAVILLDGRVVLALPSEDPLVSGSLLVTTSWRDGAIQRRQLPAPPGINVQGLSVDRGSLLVASSGWAFMSVNLEDLPFSPQTARPAADTLRARRPGSKGIDTSARRREQIAPRSRR